jgi:hypothetical protein
MKATVLKEGLLIPKKLLRGIKEVELKWEKGKILVEPTKMEEDTIFALGTNPGRSGLKDASLRHDEYVYTKKS